MAWERELEVLEEAIRRLAGEYDAFLYATIGGVKPPIESRKHVEQMIRRLSSESFDDAADRYRFSTLQGRYSRLAERWERLQAEKESGRRPGLYGHFTPDGPRRTEPPAASASLNAAASTSVQHSGGASNADRVVFQKYLDVRKARGESIASYVFEDFAENLQRERARLREKLGAEVDFDVAERDGKVKLIARRGARPATPAVPGDKK